MYNTLFGVNEMASVCLSIIDQNIIDIQRFRDAVAIKDDNGYKIEILTRTGGDNRLKYPNKELKKNKNYIKDWDDEYDPTYAHYLFSVSKDVEEIVKWDYILSRQTRNNLDLREMFETEFSDMKKPGTDAYNRATKVAKGLTRLAENPDAVKVVSFDEIMKMGE